MKSKNYIIIIIFAFILMASGCRVKKSTVYSEKEKDSIHTIAQTTYLPGLVDVNIPDQKAGNITDLKKDVDNWNNELDLFEVLYYQMLDSIEWYKAHPKEVEKIIERQVTASKGLWRSEVSRVETDFAYSDAWVEYGKLNHTIQNKDTVIPVQSDSAIKIIDQQTTNYHSKETTFSERIKKVSIPWYVYVLAGLTVVVLIFYKKIMK